MFMSSTVQSFLVTSCKKAVAKNGRYYNQLVVVDEHGTSISCFFWENTDALMDHVILLYDGVPEANSSGFRSFSEDRFAGDLGNFMKDAKLQEQYPHWASFVHPCPTFDRFQACLSHLLADWVTAPETPVESLSARQKVVRKLFEELPALYQLYCAYPAAAKFHHAYEGGLAQHTFEILYMLWGLRKTFPYQLDLFVITLAALYHDWGKTKEYTPEVFEYDETLCLKPHSVSSAEYVKDVYGEFLSEGLLERIQHCIYSHHGRKEWGVASVPATVEAFVLSELDLLSGHGAAFFAVPNLDYSSAIERRVINTPNPEE